MKSAIGRALFFVSFFTISVAFAQPSETITGRVTDGTLPIARARVMILADTLFVTTDQDGQFTLPVARYQGDNVPVMVGKTGWLNAGWQIPKGRADVELTLQPVPPGDNPNYHWIDPTPSQGGMMGMMGGGSQSCGSCHGNYYDRWQESSMAGTTRNPRVLDQYETAGEARTECADCHAPAAAVHAPGKTDLPAVAREGGVEAEGVSCDVCHKVEAVTVGIEPGVQAMRFKRVNPPARRTGMMSMQPVFAFGSLSDVFTTPMEAAYDSLYTQSEYCSSCHLDGRRLPSGRTWDYQKVYPNANPEAFDNGRVVPNQWTYQEWKNWQDGLSQDDPNKGQQCQDCHMNWTKDMLPYDQYIVEAQGGMMGRMMQNLRVRRDPSTLHPHTFQGATTNRLTNTAYLFLRPTLQGKNLSVMVSVTNTNAGHRLPTGVTFRNMLLVITARDSTGRVLSRTSGPVIPAWGGTGDPGRGNYAGQAGVGYARITGDDQGDINVPYWEATKIVSDNRIAPMQQDANTFGFDAGQAQGFITITARLIYRKAFKPMADRFGWDTGDVIMAEKSQTVYL